MSVKRLDLSESMSYTEEEEYWNRSEDKSYDKTSFSHRICDDLCELILEWLPIEDKLKLRSVSKQFNECLRSLISRQKCMEMTKALVEERCDYSRSLSLPFRSLRFSLSLPLRALAIRVDKRLERVLQILTNISEIRFGTESSNDVLNTIIKNCNNLQTIAIDLTLCHPELIEQFGQKFGQQLKSLNVLGSPEKIRRLIKFCPNLLSIDLIDIHCLVHNNVVLTQNLTKLRLKRIKSKKSIDLLLTNCPKLKHLYIETHSDSTDVLLNISQLKDLEVLSIELRTTDFHDIRLDLIIESIGLNCKKLSCFRFNVYSMKSFNSKLCFESFSQFSSLRKLCFRSYNQFDNNVITSGKLNINCLKNSKQLTHLDLKSYQLYENFFERIDAIVPHLKCLDISTNNEITDKGLKSMAKLKNLESIKLIRFGSQLFDSITDSGVLSLINDCSHLQTIQIHNKTKITSKTINALIQKSAQNPRIYFKYFFNGLENEFICNEILKTSVQSLKNTTINGIMFN